MWITVVHFHFYHFPFLWLSMSTARPRLLILYGSQTGCAADVAERIRRAAKRRHYQPALFALDDYDRVSLSCYTQNISS